MSGRTPTTRPVSTDPWAAFGSIVSGVVVYGAAGWGLGHWLGATWLLPVGVLVGAVLGTYSVIARFRANMTELDARAAAATAGRPSTPDRPPAGAASHEDHDRSTTSRGADA